MKYLRYSFFAVLILFAVVLVNTLTFEYEPYPQLPPGPTPTLDPDRVVANLVGAVRIPTVARAPMTDADRDSFHQLHAYLEQNFPLVHQNLGRETVNELSLLYHWRGDDSTLSPVLLLAHLDVVPASEASLARWTHPPFAGVVADGLIWGRGTMDDKVGVAGALQAIETLLAEGYRPRRDIYLAFGHDEEIGGTEGAAQIAALLRSRGLTFGMILDEGGSIVEQGVIPGVDTPVALVGIAEKGYVSLKLSAEAPGGHSSMPPPRTAVGRIAAAVNRIETHPFPVNMSLSRQTFTNVGPKMSGLNKVAFANLWLMEPLVSRVLTASPGTNASVRTTTAATMISGGVKDNVLPDRAEAVINFRIMPGQNKESVMAYVRGVVDDPLVQIDIYGDGGDPSSVSDTDGPFFRLLAQTIQQVETHADLVVTPYLVVGGTDAKHYQGLSNAIYRFTFMRLTPETTVLMHAINERIAVADYLDKVRFLYLLIRNSDALQ